MTVGAPIAASCGIASWLIKRLFDQFAVNGSAQGLSIYMTPTPAQFTVTCGAPMFPPFFDTNTVRSAKCIFDRFMVSYGASVFGNSWH